jgi:PTS system mannose-specific IID component
MSQIKKLDWVKTYLRSFYIQVGWNYERMIALGFTWILLPIAKRLYPEKEKLKDFCMRHLKFFNANPYLASYAVGAVANLEKKGAPPEQIERFKEVLQGPLGSLGDNLFWFNFRPALLLLGIILSSLYGIWGIIIFWSLYNLHQVYVRGRGIYKGYTQGANLTQEFGGRYLTYGTRLLNISGGIFLGILVLHKLERSFSEDEINVLIVLLSGIFSFYFFKKKVNPALIITILFILLLGAKAILG